MFDDHFSSHEDELESLNFSNDTRDACKTACKLCGKELYLMRMRGHTKDKHDMNITDYKMKFNLQGFDIIEKVFHRCALCSDIMLLDSDTIATHLNKHDITHKAYNDKYMNMMVATRVKSTGENKRPRPSKITEKLEKPKKVEPIKKISDKDDLMNIYRKIYLKEKVDQPKVATVETKVLSHDEMHLADWPHECSEELGILNYYYEIQ